VKIFKTLRSVIEQVAANTAKTTVGPTRDSTTVGQQTKPKPTDGHIPQMQAAATNPIVAEDVRLPPVVALNADVNPLDVDAKTGEATGNQTKIGRVEEINRERGFGYLEGRIWFHFKHIAFDFDPKDGDEVEYVPQTNEKGQKQAHDVRPKGQPYRPNDFYISTLEKWADVKLDRKLLENLAGLALKEDWDFKEHPWATKRPFLNLKNYLNNTFLRIYREGKIVEREGYSAWNTGLVDRLYRPIYACFRERKGSTANEVKNWSFEYFCVVGQGPNGDAFRSRFAGSYPVEARFFREMDDIYFDADTEFPFEMNDYHVLKQGIEENRYPIGFLDRFAGGFDSSRFRADSKGYLKEVAERVNGNDDIVRDCVDRIEKAVALAKLRGRWNYRSVVPVYYPKFNQVSFLLPLCLKDDHTTDAALVFQKETLGNGTKQYVARTIFNLAMAYQNARLVAKPISDWLDLDIINGQQETQ
jgi:Domain of unknown function (DUF3825)